LCRFKISLAEKTERMIYKTQKIAINFYIVEKSIHHPKQPSPNAEKGS